MASRTLLSKEYGTMMSPAQIHTKTVTSAECIGLSLFAQVSINPEMDLFTEDDISMNIWGSLHSPFSKHAALSMVIWQNILKRSCQISAYSASH